jgi:uracil-DNA glycosylase family 4
MAEVEYAELLDKVRSPGAFGPENLLAMLHECVAGCRRCGLWLGAPDVAVGIGPASARLMIVSLQPDPPEGERGGNVCGPTVEWLKEPLARAGIGLPDVYFAHAVKHLAPDPPRKGEERPESEEEPEREEVPEGSSASALETCRLWLEAEIAIVKPEVVFCLGSRAASAVLGLPVDLKKDRGRPFHPGFVPTVLVTESLESFARVSGSSERKLAGDRLLEELHDAAEVLGVSDPFKGRDELAQL